MDFNDQDIIYKVAINMIPGVGAVGIRRLTADCGSERALFENLDDLTGGGKVHPKIAEAIRSSNLLDKAKAQIEICNRHNINMLYILDRNYPQRLAKCDGAPTLLYSLGNVNFDRMRSIAVVGTRSCDADGKNNIHSLIEKLKADNYNVIIVSGLALGADTFAHQAALEFGLPTVAVLGHGLNMVYPAENRQLAGDIVHSGGALITEYYFGQQVNKNNFPRRNRIIAGLCDALIVAQSKAKGGALITAEYARDYRREVFAFPGRVCDKLYAGCNHLIANRMASLISNADDLIKTMGWKINKYSEATQAELKFIELTSEQASIIDALHANGASDVDTLALLTAMTEDEVASLLLTMEFEDLVVSLPGKRYASKV